MCKFSVNSQQISIDLCNYLEINPGKKSYTVNFPLLENYNLKRLFLRGYFEGDGCVATQNTKAKVPKVSISSNSSNMLNSIHEYVGNGCVYKNQILWGYNKALEFLDLIYKNHNDLFLERKYNLYIYWKNNYIFNSRKNRRVFQ
jgi:hypothetical protein